MKQEIFLHEFTHKDFENLISWVNNEKELIQFAGPIFSFPLTKEQLNDYLKDPNRYPFKIVLKIQTWQLDTVKYIRQAMTSLGYVELLLEIKPIGGKDLVMMQL